MFSQRTEYERAVLIYNFMTSGSSFQHKKDLGNVYELSSDGTDLKFFDTVKVRRTNKSIRGKEIILLNLTPYGYVNLEGLNKFNMVSGLEHLFNQNLFGFEVKSLAEEATFHNILTRKQKYQLGSVNYIETEAEWKKRTSATYNLVKDMSKGFLNKFAFFFVSNDPQMIKPLDFTGYLFFLARSLNDIERSMVYCVERLQERLEMFFGSDVTDIQDKYKEYLEIANILGVQLKTEDIDCRYNSLEEIQKNEKSRIYAYLEVVKYFFKNGMKFSDEDIKNIKDRTYNIRSIYSALGGKYCMKKGEEKDMIAYFTALRCTKDDLPLLINTENESAKNVLFRRFDLSR